MCIRDSYNTAKAYTPDTITRMNRAGRQSHDNIARTSWITDNRAEINTDIGETQSYSVLAHEIGHIMGELNHVSSSGGNLMNLEDRSGSKSAYLSPEQCRQINKPLTFVKYPHKRHRNFHIAKQDEPPKSINCHTESHPSH